MNHETNLQVPYNVLSSGVSISYIRILLDKVYYDDDDIIVTVIKQSSSKNSIIINNNKYFSWVTKTREIFKTRFLAEHFRSIKSFIVLKYAKRHVIN